MAGTNAGYLQHYVKRLILKEMPIKLISPNRWITAMATWTEIRLNKTELQKSVSVDPNFLLEVKQVY